MIVQMYIVKNLLNNLKTLGVLPSNLILLKITFIPIQSKNNEEDN